MNFAMARDDSREMGENHNVIACTLDAKWDNKCEVHPIIDIVEINWLYMDTESTFDMAEGMCAHQIILTGEYIVFSCSKLFQDGSARKVRILSFSSLSVKDGHP